MRYFKIMFMLLAIPFVFASCAKDEDKLEGTWNIDKVEYKSYINGELEEEGVDTNEGTITFKEDGTGSFDGTDPFTWSLSDDILKITETDEGETYIIEIEIETLTKDKFVGKLEESETLQGVEFRYETKLTMSKL